MENTPRETAEGPVLLSWEMPDQTRRLFKFLPLAILIVVLGAYGIAMWRFYDRASIRATATLLLLAYAFLQARLILPLRHSAAILEVTTNGVGITTVTGPRYVLPWTHVRVLKRGIYGFTELSDPPGSVYLPIPPDVRDKLIAILREASDARIIGFEPEES